MQWWSLKVISETVKVVNYLYRGPDYCIKHYPMLMNVVDLVGRVLINIDVSVDCKF